MAKAPRGEPAQAPALLPPAAASAWRWSSQTQVPLPLLPRTCPPPGGGLAQAPLATAPTQWWSGQTQALPPCHPELCWPRPWPHCCQLLLLLPRDGPARPKACRHHSCLLATWRRAGPGPGPTTAPTCPLPLWAASLAVPARPWWGAEGKGRWDFGCYWGGGAWTSKGLYRYTYEGLGMVCWAFSRDPECQRGGNVKWHPHLRCDRGFVGKASVKWEGYFSPDLLATISQVYISIYMYSCYLRYLTSILRFHSLCK